MKRFLGIAALTGTLAACSAELSPEQRTALDRDYLPQVNTFIPACIAVATGQKADYPAIRALGFTRRDVIFGRGDYFYNNDGMAKANKTVGITFVPGKGCHTKHIGFPGVLTSDIEVYQTWVRALETAGYRNTDTSSSIFSFVANCVNLRLTATDPDDGGPTSYAIMRAN